MGPRWNTARIRVSAARTSWHSSPSACATALLIRVSFLEVLCTTSRAVPASVQVSVSISVSCSPALICSRSNGSFDRTAEWVRWRTSRLQHLRGSSQSSSVLSMCLALRILRKAESSL